MEVKQLSKAFTKYVSLNIFSMLGLSLYILADTYFVSAGAGSLGVAALNIVLPVYSLLSALGLMLGMGGATNYSISRGKNEEREGNVYFTHVIGIAVLISLVFMGAALPAKEITMFLGAQGAVIDLAVPYLRTILLFSPAFLLNQVLICFVRNDKRPDLAMAAMLSGSLSNIVLDYLFIFPLNLGMFGAALATGLAPVISMGILSVHFWQKKKQLPPDPLPGGGSLWKKLHGPWNLSLCNRIFFRNHYDGF